MKYDAWSMMVGWKGDTIHRSNSDSSNSMDGEIASQPITSSQQLGEQPNVVI